MNEERFKRLPLDEMFGNSDEVVAKVHIIRTAPEHRGKDPYNELLCLQWMQRRADEGTEGAPCVICKRRIEADDSGWIFPPAFLLLRNAAAAPINRMIAITCICEVCIKKTDDELAREVMSPYMKVIDTYKPSESH